MSLTRTNKEPELELTLAARLPLGFTFSYPVEQDSVDRGSLVTWTKGFDIKGVEGQDVVIQLGEAINKRVRNTQDCRHLAP